MLPIMDLEALEEIRRLKYRYFRALDLKLWDEYADWLSDVDVAKLPPTSRRG